MIDTTNPHPVEGFAAAHAATPNFFVATPMKVRSAPKKTAATEIKTGVNDVAFIDPGVSVPWLAASWESGTPLANAKVGDVDRLYLLIGDDPTNPLGWVCYYEEYKTKDPDEAIDLHWGGLTANSPPTQAETDAAVAQLAKDKTDVDAFLKSIGKTRDGGDAKTGGGGKKALGFGVVLAGLGIGYLLYNANKKK